jgi:UDP-N-acetylglucosamine 2-epimerase
MVGNSSSGIVEAPVLNLPVINVGNRQKGRYLSRNIVPCGEGLLALQQAFDRMRSKEYLMSLQQTEAYYGDGHTAHRILMHLKEFRPGALQKNFYEK